MTIKPLFPILALSLLTIGAQAQVKSFQIIGDKLSYRNTATFESVADFESVTGKTTNVSGWIKFDPKSKKGSGMVQVDVKSIDTGIAQRNEHMQSSMWLDADKFPAIKFETTKVSGGNKDVYSVTGKLSLHGVTKVVTTKATVQYRAASADTKAKGFEGDVLRLSTRFEIKLSDYGVNIPAFVKGKVSNDVTIAVTAYALAN